MTPDEQPKRRRRRVETPLPEGERLVRLATVCRMVETPVRSLQRLVSAGQFPRPAMYMGRSPRWKLSVIQAFIEGRWKG
jgi:predicted DNA-binding transcriptional regulator AlpA